VVNLGGSSFAGSDKLTPPEYKRVLVVHYIDKNRKNNILLNIYYSFAKISDIGLIEFTEV